MMGFTAVSMLMTLSYKRKFQKYLSLLLNLFYLIFLGVSCDLFKSDENEDIHIDFPHLGPIDFSPSWSVNDDIIYCHASFEDCNPNVCGLYLIDPHTSKKKLLMRGYPLTPDWSPDGKWIVFSSENQIFKTSVNGSLINPIQLTFEGKNHCPRWSPDGKKIVWVCDDNICIMDSSGENKRKLRDWSRWPNWSLDGSELICVCLPGVENNGICIFDTSGSNLRLLLKPEDVGALSAYELKSPIFSPDGSKILFFALIEAKIPGTEYTRGENQVFMVNYNGTNLVQLTEQGGSYPDWSPNGKFIVYCKHPIQIEISLDLEFSTTKELFDSLDLPPGIGHLWIMETDGSGKRMLTSVNLYE